MRVIRFHGRTPRHVRAAFMAAEAGKITDNLEEGAYRRGVAWDVFSNEMETYHHDEWEIQKIDCVEHRDVPEELNPEGGNPWFEDDHEAEIMVCFLALDGHLGARRALREVGCTNKELEQFFGCAYA